MLGQKTAQQRLHLRLKIFFHRLNANLCFIVILDKFNYFLEILFVQFLLSLAYTRIHVELVSKPSKDFGDPESQHRKHRSLSVYFPVNVTILLTLYIHLVRVLLTHRLYSRDALRS